MLSALSFVVFVISLGTFIASLRIYIESTDSLRRQQESVSQLRTDVEKTNSVLLYNETEMRRLSRAASDIEDMRARLEGVRIVRLFGKDLRN
jgi:vacuolar-type H+-ATPase subunit I/STV1